MSSSPNDALATIETRRRLLRCFTAHVGWAERECVQKTWRTIRGEAPLGSKALPAPMTVGDGAAGGSANEGGSAGVGRMFGLHNFRAGDLLGDGNYSQVFEATVKPTQEKVALKVRLPSVSVYLCYRQVDSGRGREQIAGGPVCLPAAWRHALPTALRSADPACRWSISRR